MKNCLIHLAFAGSILSFGACSSANNPQTEPEKTPEMVSGNGQPENGFISGTVTEIQPGKDGYTARLITEAGEEYYATISRANLSDPDTYRTVKTGETITIKGDQWQMENQEHITVRELK